MLPDCSPWLRRPRSAKSVAGFRTWVRWGVRLLVPSPFQRTPAWSSATHSRSRMKAEPFAVGQPAACRVSAPLEATSPKRSDFLRTELWRLGMRSIRTANCGRFAGRRQVGCRTLERLAVSRRLSVVFPRMAMLSWVSHSTPQVTAAPSVGRWPVGCRTSEHSQGTRFHGPTWSLRMATWSSAFHIRTRARRSSSEPFAGRSRAGCKNLAHSADLKLPRSRFLRTAARWSELQYQVELFAGRRRAASKTWALLAGRLVPML